MSSTPVFTNTQQPPAIVAPEVMKLTPEISLASLGLYTILSGLYGREVSLDELSALTGTSRPTVVKSIKTLVEAGLIEKVKTLVPNSNGGSRQGKNSYRVIVMIFPEVKKVNFWKNPHSVPEVKNLNSGESATVKDIDFWKNQPSDGTNSDAPKKASETASPENTSKESIILSVAKNNTLRNVSVDSGIVLNTNTKNQESVLRTRTHEGEKQKPEPTPKPDTPETVDAKMQAAAEIVNMFTATVSRATPPVRPKNKPTRHTRFTCSECKIAEFVGTKKASAEQGWFWKDTKTAWCPSCRKRFQPDTQKVNIIFEQIADLFFEAYSEAARKAAMPRISMIVYGDKGKYKTEGLLAFEASRQNCEKGELDFTQLETDVLDFAAWYKRVCAGCSLRSVTTWMEYWVKWTDEAKQEVEWVSNPAGFEVYG